MSNRQILRDIVALSSKLKPKEDKPFVNKVFVAATEMLVDEPPDEQRRDGLTNHERMLRNKAKREASPKKEREGKS